MANRDVLRRLYGGECFSCTESAALLGVSRATVDRWIEAGLLEFIRYGNRTYVTEDGLKKFWQRSGAKYVQPELPFDDSPQETVEAVGRD